MNLEKLKSRGLVIFILGCLAVIGPFSIDMYLPGFKDIAKDLNTSISQVGLSLSSFFIGVSLGQLIYGPLLDRFGRKIPLYVGLIIYLISSVLCALVLDVDHLIAARFFQALGSCAGMVAARALVRDLFPVSENAKIFSYLMLVIAISPIIAPTFGGYITAMFGWRSIFLSLAAISIVIIVLTYFWLPEGNPPDTELSLKPRPIVKGYLAVAKVPQFYTYALVSAVSSSGLYAYIAGSPNLFMNIFEVSKEHYGWIFAFIAVGIISASQVNTVLLRKYTSEQITLAALYFQVATGIFLAVSTYFNWLDLYTTIAVIWIYLATQGFVYPNTSALSIAPFSRNAGTASALMGAVQLGIGAIVTVIVNAFTSGSAFPMGFTMFLCGTTSFLILLTGRRLIKKKGGGFVNNPVQEGV